MSVRYLPTGNRGAPAPRRQAERLLQSILQESPPLRAVLWGRRGEGKTDLLRQLYARLFDARDGPIPFLYTFRQESEQTAARRFVAAFCRQVQAYLLRQQRWLWEPAGGFGNPGEPVALPPSLIRLVQNFLALPAQEQLDDAASLPERFANLAGQPLCLLLDDIQVLDRGSPFLGAVDSPQVSCIRSGRYASALRLAGEASWPLIALEPFSGEEALQLAEKSCRETRVGFEKEIWEEWFQMAGPSPLLLRFLVHAAAVSGQPLHSAEHLGAVYLQDLTSGTLGNWLATRLQQAVPHRQERAMVCQFLEGVSGGVAAREPPSWSEEVWEGLIAEEWAEATRRGPVIQLDPVQQDWLSLAGTPSRLP